MSTLELRHVSMSYGGVQFLRDVSLTVRDGELAALLGVSGSGKTTLFNIAAGLLVPDDGQVLLDGEDVTGTPGQVSYMMQKDLLFPFRTVIDNVALPLMLRGVDKRTAREKASAHFAEFGLEGTQRQYPAQLSGGMRQRAAFLRTCLASEKVALLDEPFSALDPLTRSSIHDWYLSVMDRLRLTTCLVTHDVSEAVLLADRVYLLGGSPATITAEIVIDVPRPRPSDFLLSPVFADYSRKILSLIRADAA